MSQAMLSCGQCPHQRADSLSSPATSRPVHIKKSCLAHFTSLSIYVGVCWHLGRKHFIAFSLIRSGEFSRFTVNWKLLAFLRSSHRHLQLSNSPSKTIPPDTFSAPVL